MSTAYWIRVAGREFTFGGYSKRDAMEKFLASDFGASIRPTKLAEDVQVTVVDTDDFTRDVFVLSVKLQAQP